MAEHKKCPKPLSESQPVNITDGMDSVEFIERQRHGDYMDEIDDLRRQLAESKAELAKAREIVGRLPKTKDGVPVTPRMDLYGVNGAGHIIVMEAPTSKGPCMWWYSECYSTRAAALGQAEREKGAGGK